MTVAAAGATVKIFGVTLVGISTTTGVKLLFTTGLVLVVLLLRGLALAISRRFLGGEVGDSRRFWARQGIQVLVTTGVGLVSAGLAFALQQVITALAAYFVILAGTRSASVTASPSAESAATSSGSASSRPRSWRWANHPRSPARTPRSGSTPANTPGG